MSRYIDTDAVHEKYDRYANHSSIGRCNGKTLARFLDWLDDQPTADVREVVHGEWIVEEAEVGGVSGIAVATSYICSICSTMNEYQDNFCPNCGARMDGAKND